MTEPLKLIIFDLDGTLVDAYRAVSKSLNYAFNTMGLPLIDDMTVQRNVGWGDSHLIEQFAPPNLVEQTLAIYREHHGQALKSGTKFLPGVPELLQDLKRKNFLMAIASNRPSIFTEIILDNLAIRSYFAQVVCADQVARPKPQPDMLNHILRQLSLMPQQALYVGDMIIDVETGQRANIRTVAVATGSSTREELAALKPFNVVVQIRDILPIIEDFGE
ncbi:MAG: HAD family hydrolase [Candidatus Omnitrophota bacterium]|nr:HAD family hydrolase [Candidatus Omnitrophota bacterium]